MKKYIISFLAILLILPSITSASNKVTVHEPKINSHSAILINLNNNKVLYEKNIDEQVPIGELTKIMTAHIISEEIHNGELSLTDKVKISHKAWRTGGNRMFLEVGTEYTLEEVLKGMIILSGNDAAVALAEHSSGTTEKFIEKMNIKANDLGMKNTDFKSVNGTSTNDVSTASDLKILSTSYIEKFPDILKFHTLEKYTTKTRTHPITQMNENPLVGTYNNLTGLHSGYKSGFWNMIGSSEKNGLKLLSVNLKASSNLNRQYDTMRLLNYGYKLWQPVTFGKANDKAEKVPVYKSSSHKSINLILENDLTAIVNVNNIDKISTQNIELPNYIEGGVKQGTVVGKQIISLDGKVLKEVNIITSETTEKGDLGDKFFGMFGIIANNILNFLTGLL